MWQIKQVAQKIWEEAFWGEYKFTPEEIEKILLDRKRYRERLYLFTRGLFNLREPAILLKVFSPDEIKKFLKELPLARRNQFHRHRLLLWRNVFLGEKNEIPGIKWREK